ncbi:DUF6218 family protein [Corynebacterium ulceribovis]|uniref:DUF6218 family protein n=1 Tax=Corynebacterium ulceribovis TaxID=487732 RepID=UPI00036DE9FF|nr:DUF6218 family protein [Corynebacterium ulceribovis]
MPALEFDTPRTLAVIDATDSGTGATTFAVWHIELTTDITTGRLSGAWLLTIDAPPLEASGAQAGADNVTKLKDLLTLTPVHATDAAHTALADLTDTQPDALPELDFVDPVATVAALRTYIDDMTAAAKNYKESGNAISLPRFPKVPDLTPLDAAYHGEAAGKTAHAWAMAWRELIGTWLDIVSVRRRRKYLAEFGPARPDEPEYFPLVTAS